MITAKKYIREFVKPIVEKITRFRAGKLMNRFSFLEEETIIDKYLDRLPLSNKFCVDIAASDGISMSNTYFLYKKGWNGIAVECDPVKFASLSNSYKVFSDVNLVKAKVTPENVVFLLKACRCPTDFAFLNLDIDSYDYFVLDKLLDNFRPSLICLEINEKIPPPISFTVKYIPEHFWKGDHFYGQSISRCYKLCKKYNYDIVELCYNNMFIIPKEINKQKALSPEVAYKNGYKNKADRRDRFPWNSDMEYLLSMSKNDGKKFINNKFNKYKGMYILE